MNYSYIKTVFPTFENTIAYDKNTFNKLKQPVSSEHNTHTLNVTGINNGTGVPIGVPLKNESEKFYATQEKLLESPIEYSTTSGTNKEHFGDVKSNTNDVAEYTKHTVPSKQIDNLHYYNLPINKEYLHPNYSSQKLNTTPSPTKYSSNSYIETFSDNASDKSENPVVLQPQVLPSQVLPSPPQLADGNCTQRYNHVMECNHCKEMLYKTLNLNTNKNSYTEEIFELISYCVFAIFILFLLDKIAK
jgi:hypothetical protein